MRTCLVSKNASVRFPTRRLVRASAAAAPAGVGSLSPLGTRLLVRPEESSGVTESGLVLAGTARDETASVLFGEVIAAGPEAKCASAGSKVMFAKFSCTEVEYEGDKLFFVEDKSILATIE